MNDLAVVVPIYISNEKDIIFETLRNIRNQVDCKIYVPWNGKDGDEKNIIKQISLLATPLYVEKSRSKAENLNAFLDFIPPEIKYIVILDADSRPKEKCISILYHKIKNTPPEIGWIQGNYSVNRGKNRIVVDLDESENRLACKLEKILSSNASFKGHDAIFKREVLEKADGFNPNCLLEDKDLTMRLHKLGFSGQREENYKSSSEACPTWKDFFRQRSRWIQGGHEINRLSTWGSVVIFVFLLMVAFLFGWWFLFSFFGISFLLLIGFFIFFPLIIFYRAILSIKIILGYGPKKFIASKRNITDATSNTLAVYRLKINRNKEIT